MTESSTSVDSLRGKADVATPHSTDAAGATPIPWRKLDNMAPAVMSECVRLVNGRAILEASGGVNLSTVRSIAETGVDWISVGALTHSAPSLDIALDFE